MNPVRRVAIASALLFPCLCAGCLAARKDAFETIPGDKKIVGPTEYEYVYVTGSHIPVRVPKSSTARPLPPAYPVSTYDLEAFERMIRQGQGAGAAGR